MWETGEADRERMVVVAHNSSRHFPPPARLVCRGYATVVLPSRDVVCLSLGEGLRLVLTHEGQVIYLPEDELGTPCAAAKFANCLLSSTRELGRLPITTSNRACRTPR